MDQPKHAVYGPSTLKYRELCPGWRQDNTGDMSRADEGTRMHLASETGNLAGLDPEQTECVKACLNYAAPYIKAAQKIYRELRLVIMEGLTFGTADLVTIDGKHAHIIDWKYGRGFIDDAEINRQGISYAIGVFEAFSVDTVTVHFVIPRRDEVTTHTFKREQLPELQTMIRYIIQRCIQFAETQDESMLNDNFHACGYCGNVGSCPKHLKRATDIVAKYAPLEILTETHSSKITDPAVMALALDNAKVVERWVESVKKHASDFAKEGGQIPGYSLREKNGSRGVSNPVLAYGVLKSLGLEPEEIASSATFALGKLEALISEKSPRGQKSKAIAAMHAALAEADALSFGAPSQYLMKEGA